MPWTPWGSATRGSRPTAQGPTGRWSGSTGPWLRSGPTSGCTGPTPNAFVPSRDGSTSTIGEDPTPRWVARLRSPGSKQRRWELHLAALAAGDAATRMPGFDDDVVGW